MSDETVTIRVRTEHGEEHDRELTIVHRMKGVSVVDRDHGDHFGSNLATAIETLCGYHGWTWAGVDGHSFQRTAPESRVDRAMRLHAAYVAARGASREATASLTDEEFKEFRERVGR